MSAAAVVLRLLLAMRCDYTPHVNVCTVQTCAADAVSHLHPFVQQLDCSEEVMHWNCGQVAGP